MEVKWVGYPSSQNTFEPLKQIYKDVPDLVESYLESKGLTIKTVGNSIKIVSPEKPVKSRSR